MESASSDFGARPRSVSREQDHVADVEVSLGTVLATSLLAARATRKPDHAAEARALQRIAHAMEASPIAALNALVEEGVNLCSNGNATTGVSLLEDDGGAQCFRWTAMAGRLAEAIGGSTPRSFSPCGVCLDQNKPVLFRRPDTYFTYFLETGVPFTEGLVLPFYVAGQPAGTLWIVSHDDSRGFDTEDVRIMASLAEFAGIAYFTMQRRDEAASASSEKSEFLALMSHELRTPLNAIGGYAELIEMGLRGPVTPQQMSDLRRIRESQNHLLALINQVLDHAQLERGTAHYDIANVDVLETVRAALALVEPQARAKGLATSTILRTEQRMTVRADGEKLLQILVNLLTNAVKFTEAGGAVSLECSLSDGKVRLSVSDSGCGIAPEVQRRVFDAFVQGTRRLDRAHEGVGLGLAISREFARAMGGDIVVESTVGAGSTFTVSLPAATPGRGD